MKTSILKYIIALATTAVLPSAVSAQSISESVTVEGKYKPEIIPADRLAILPTTITLKAPESPMTYDRKGVAANFAPDALSMPATGWRATKNYDTSRGYLNLRLGSWLNSSLSAGVAAIRNDNTRLNLYLQHNSTSLWQAWNEDKASGTPAADNRYRYDETLGANLSRRFSDAGTLTAALQYHLGYFNYYGTSIGPIVDGKIKAPSQTINDILASANWNANTNGHLHYSIKADYRHFAYRAMYTLSGIETPSETETPSLIYGKGLRESLVNVGGTLAYDFSSRSKLDVELLYTGVINSIGNDVNRFRILPAYNYTGDHYSLRIGVDMAAVANGETKFRIAPDVRFSTRKGISAFTVNIGGGTYLRTLAWMHMMDYYADPSAGCYNAAYSPLDINIAYQLNPGGKWTFGVEGLWRSVIHESFGGLYQAYLNGISEKDEEMADRIHGFSIAVNAGYEFNRYFSLKGKMAWQPQHGTTGILNGFDRPAITADLSAESRPTDKLSIALDYGLRAKRLLLPSNISHLNLSADYRITDKFSVGAEFNNLFNRHEELLPGLMSEGFNATAGVQIVF